MHNPGAQGGAYPPAASTADEDGDDVIAAARVHKLESTVRYLGIEVDGAQKIAVQIEA